MSRRKDERNNQSKRKRHPVRRVLRKWGLPLWLVAMLAAGAWGWQTGDWRAAIVVGLLPIAELIIVFSA